MWGEPEDLVHARYLQRGAYAITSRPSCPVFRNFAAVLSVGAGTGINTRSLAPPAPDPAPGLPALHQDLARIAEALQAIMTGEARTLQRTAGKALALDG